MSLTGFEDPVEQSLAMFQILALLEMQAQAYLESDIHALGLVRQSGVGNPLCQDRLLSYLALSSRCRKSQPRSFSRLDPPKASPVDMTRLKSATSLSRALSELTSSGAISSEVAQILDYLSRQDYTDEDAKELNEKLKVQQEALHERYKELAERDKVIA